MNGKEEEKKQKGKEEAEKAKKGILWRTENFRTVKILKTV